MNKQEFINKFPLTVNTNEVDYSEAKRFNPLHCYGATALLHGLGLTSFEDLENVDLGETGWGVRDGQVAFKDFIFEVKGSKDEDLFNEPKQGRVTFILKKYEKSN